jgi:metal-responsive CopG/Arc/MetJ family transcriptional regulator
MKRTQVFLPDQLIKKLEKMSAKKGISKGEIIRRALEEFFKAVEKELMAGPP